MESEWLAVVDACRARVHALNDAFDRKLTAELEQLAVACRNTISGKVCGSVEVAIGYCRKESQETLANGLGDEPWTLPSSSALSPLSGADSGSQSFDSLISDIRITCVAEIEKAISSGCETIGCDPDSALVARIKQELLSFLDDRVASVYALVELERAAWCNTALQLITQVTIAVGF